MTLLGDAAGQGTVDRPRPGRIGRALIAPIRIYQRYLSPHLAANCRYYPTCSAYAVQAVTEHGAAGGTWLTIRRLGRCHPWSRRDHIDLVPEPREPKTRQRSSRSGRGSPEHPLAGSTFAGSTQSGDTQRAGL